MDWKVKAVKMFAEQIRPGWRANTLAACLRLHIRMCMPRADVAMRNIDIIFPDISPEEKKKILVESYENIIWTGVETLAQQRAPHVRRAWIHEIEGDQYFLKAYSKGKGIIGLAGHIGNWELAASILTPGVPVTAIIRNPDNIFYRDLIETMRASVGVKTIDKRDPMIRGISVLLG